MTANNVTPIRNDADAPRAARAAFVHNALTSKRWSIRAAARELDMSHTALAGRMKADTAFTGEEIIDIAELLERDPVEFFGEYLEVGRTGLEPVTVGL